MPTNKVVYCNKTLIDLTGDTVTEASLIRGYTAHRADGTIITGTAFAGYPNEYIFSDTLEDSNGKTLYSSTGAVIEGRTIYRKARTSTLLDSSGDVIDDSV